MEYTYVQVPHVKREEYTLLDINEDGYVSVPPPCSLLLCLA